MYQQRKPIVTNKEKKKQKEKEEAKLKK